MSRDFSHLRYLVDPPPMFDFFLSREFTFKLGGYIVIHYSHMSIPFHNRIFNVFNHPIIGFLTKKLPQVNMINEQALLTNVVEMELDFVDLVFELLINQIERKGMGNYVIFEYIIDLPSLNL